MKLRRTMKAQKEEKKKEKVKKEEDPNLGHEWDPQEANPLRESLGDLEKDVDSSVDPEKDVGDPKDRTSHS